MYFIRMNGTETEEWRVFSTQVRIGDKYK